MGDAVSQLLDGEGTGERHPTFKFAAVGDTIKGTLVGNRVVSTPKLDGTGTEEVVLLEVVDDNGETFSVFLNSFRQRTAVRAAVNLSGASTLENGGRIALKYDGSLDTGKPSPAKTYVAQYQPPAKEANQLSVDDLL